MVDSASVPSEPEIGNKIWDKYWNIFMQQWVEN